MAPKGQEPRGKSGGKFPYRSRTFREDIKYSIRLTLNFTDIESWHPSGWSPVYDRLTSRQHLVGFITLQYGINRLVIDEEMLGFPPNHHALAG